MNTTNINIRGIDRKLYQQFKSAIYSQGAKNVKEAICELMRAAINDNKIITRRIK